MSRTHNKKRNVGIIYEQLVAIITRSLVEQDSTTANKALKIIKNNFKQGTELYKEFRLFNALMQTYVKSDALASRIISESKSAALTHNPFELNKQKSKLIKDINYTFGKDGVYKTQVSEYKILATIQGLLNDWRNPSYDVTKRVQYETRIHEWLTKEKTVETIESMKTPNINDLTVKIMRETFNKKFGDNLNENQKSLLKALMFEGDIDDDSYNSIVEEMETQRENALSLIKEYQRQCDSQHVKSKIPKAIALLESLDTKDTSDSNIVKCLSVTRLCDELMEKK